MEKVILTQEQAEHIELVKSERNIETVIGNVFFNKRKYRRENSINDVIESIGLEKMLKAIYIGYEVEPEFKVGDWIIDEFSGSMTIIENAGYANDLNNCRNNIRKATKEEIAKEKQRRWWAKHDRDVWELKKGDIIEKLYTPLNLKVREITGVDDQFIYARGFEVERIFKINTNTTQIDANYKVICFFEDRKDIPQGGR